MPEFFLSEERAISLPTLSLLFIIYHLSFSASSPSPVCQNFSWIFGRPKRLDGKFRGEILKIERRKLQDFSPKIVVKPRVFFKSLKLSYL
jgi:hypothetical protein